MTDKPRKWEPARRQSRRVLSSLGLRPSPGQQPPNPEDRTTPPHTAAAGIMAALNYASESRAVTIPEIESMPASESTLTLTSASSSAAASESLGATAADAPAVVAVAAPSTGPTTISGAVSSSSAPIATSLLSLPFFTSSVSSASAPFFASIGSSERGGSVVASSAPARAATPASASMSTTTPTARFTFVSSTSTSTPSMSESDVFSSLPTVSVPVRVRSRLPATSTSTSTSHTTTNTPTPITIATNPIPSTATATPTSIASAATSASITAPLQPINPFYRPRQRSLSFYDASTSEDAALPQNRHLVQSQIHGGVGSSRYVAAIRDAALGVSEEEESESERESESETSEEELIRRRLPFRRSEREGSAFGRDPFFFATQRHTGSGAAVVGFSSSVLGLASASASAGVVGSSVSASASLPSQRQAKTSASVQKSTSYPFRSEDLDAAYRRASFGSGFNSSIDSHVHSGGESPLKGILKRRYAAPSKSPSAREKRVSFMEGSGAGEDEGDVFGDDNEGLPREVVEFVGKLVEDEDVGEGEVGGEVAATAVVDEVGAESDTVSVTVRKDGGDDVVGEKSSDSGN
ncbi:uncharacterized protein LDX57_003243 [Aspergillus melleus]|uniref:uncharacterized protein n=1 Tax=Aspergillus melleus TaxID=138277 RepID=UPI001E8CAD3C|nr:uncharacterized protein LDX57_003243 [Aspergillus melleus]KAH8425492.1 hypothetical protein LDX57_003243 [Aspergillus melleus]